MLERTTRGWKRDAQYAFNARLRARIPGGAQETTSQVEVAGESSEALACREQMLMSLTRAHATTKLPTGCK